MRPPLLHALAAARLRGGLAAWLWGAAAAAAAAVAAPTTLAASAAASAPPAVAASRGSASWAEWPAFQPCWLRGLAQQARCGVVMRPLGAAASAPRIALHVAVLPAAGRGKRPDAVLFLAGGPGQSAIDLAGHWQERHGALNRQRDLVFVDQRGTGRSASLACPDDAPTAALRPLAQQLDARARRQRLADCREALQRLPHGDLTRYGTPAAAEDLEAVRQALGVPRWNVIASSYGTRVALELMRQQPTTVRRAVLDGVVPPDMGLTQSLAADTLAALQLVISNCGRVEACARRFPGLADAPARLLARAPWATQLPHPLSGQPQPVTLDAATLLGLMRAPLYAPALAAGLPAALHEAAAGRPSALAALASALGGSGLTLSSGMHHAVVCSEDLPAEGAPPPTADEATGPMAALQAQYQLACNGWPRAVLPAGFGHMPAAQAPVWLLSGGADPATPPRHAERVLKALGPLARHTVAPAAGHGLIGMACVREAVQAFIEAEADAQALQLPARAAQACAQAMPPPLPFLPPGLP